MPIIPGVNATVHRFGGFGFRHLAQTGHRLVLNRVWAEVRPHSEETEKYTKRVLGFLAEVEADGRGRLASLVGEAWLAQSPAGTRAAVNNLFRV